MRKVIAALNMTLDGFCNHEYGVADDELHDHYTNLLNNGDTLVYGRTTYQLMEDYWPALVKKPSGIKANDDFALAIDRIEKIVFSHSLKELNWGTAKLATGSFEEEMNKLKEQPGGDILIGSPSLIVAGLNLGLVDELQIGIQPMIVGKGLPLFHPISEAIDLQLSDTKRFKSGAIILFYSLSK